MSERSAPGRESPVPSALPSRRARALGFLAVVVAGLLGGLIGWAVVDLQCRTECTGWAGLGAVVGAVSCAAGVAVVSVLTLRAMDEWKANPQPSGGASERRQPGQRQSGRRR